MAESIIIYGSGVISIYNILPSPGWRRRRGEIYLFNAILFTTSPIYKQFRSVKTAMRDVNNNGRIHYYLRQGRHINI